MSAIFLLARAALRSKLLSALGYHYRLRHLHRDRVLRARLQLQAGGPPGDLYVFLSVGNHPKFTRRDYDIHSEHVISFTQAALGAEGKIDTIDGKETLKIPNGTQPGQVFRLRGKGVQFLDGSGRGDHYVHVTVKIPASLSEDQRRLLQELATLEGEHPPERGVLDKVKDFFSG